MTAQPIPTAGQTVGPFFHYALPYDGDSTLVPPGSADSIRLSGVVFDGAGDPVPDALVELWQPDAAGRISREPGSLVRDGHTFTGFGRAATDRVGRYTFTTVRPGPLAPGRAAYVALTVFARGLLDRLQTRAYLPSPELDADPWLAAVDPARRDTLIAAEDDLGLVFDIHLQGAGETVFLDHRPH